MKMFNEWKLRKDMAKTFKIPYDRTEVLYHQNEREI